MSGTNMKKARRTKASNENQTCDVFISYRREDGTALAMYLYEVLTQKGYRVFLDMNELKNGNYSDAIMEQILHCTDFISVLSPNALQGLDDKDWVRKELACALREKKNVIPVMDPKFEFPDNLPKDIENVRMMNGIKFRMDFKDASIEKLESFLESTPGDHDPWWKKLLVPAIILVLAIVGVILFLLLGRGNGGEQKPPAGSSEISLPTTETPTTADHAETISVQEPSTADHIETTGSEEPSAAESTVESTSEETSSSLAETETVGESIPQLASEETTESSEAETTAESSEAETTESETTEEETTESETTTPEVKDLYADYQIPASRALGNFSVEIDIYENSVYVYKDYGDSENHFSQRALMAGRDASLVRAMDDNWQFNPHSGDSCIRCEMVTAPGDWGGWLFINGYIPEGSDAPQINKADAPGQGIDLTNASELRFWARGEKGGEKVQFLLGGYEVGSGAPYPDSCETQRTDYIELDTEWTQYTIDLEDVDTSYLICGFGFAMSGDVSGSSFNEFYLDDIEFVGYCPNSRPLLRSYDSENVYLKNAAFSYDNAIAAMAFLASGYKWEAEEILDTFVYAVQHDRYAPGRVRNAYVAGDISGIPGWSDAARIPVWYDEETGTWQEHQHHVGCDTGNTSYVALALLQYHARYGKEEYLETARMLMDWVLEECQGEGAGFMAGYDGWPESGSDTTYPLTYKSIEHNLDAYAAFKRLAELTGEEKYQKAADSAKEFVLSMYDSKLGLFHTGTLADGKTISKENTVLDAQVWACLALGEEFEPYEAALKAVEAMKQKEGGYSFCKSNVNGGWWAEGTAFTALMYRLRGEDEKALEALEALRKIQLYDGLFPAATVDHLSTGIYLYDGTPWEYGQDQHIAPAAWFAMAVNGFNPYSFEN